MTTAAPLLLGGQHVGRAGQRLLARLPFRRQYRAGYLRKHQYGAPVQRGLTAGLGLLWGDNTSGLVGDGTNIRRLTPVPIASQLTFTTISAGGFHACGLTTAGAVYCWGSNAFGELGNGTTAASLVPVPIASVLTFASLSVGNRHNCALTAGGAAYCWGDNTDGLLGNGGSAGVSTTPVAVLGGLTFASVSAGRFHTCGVTTNGAAYCWGNNRSNTLGDGTSQTSLVPVRVR